MALPLIVFGVLFAFVAHILLVYRAFCRSVLWGLAVLFLPFANLIFIIAAWKETKQIFLLIVLAGGMMGVGISLMPDQQAVLKWAASHGIPVKLPEAPAKAAPPATPAPPALSPEAQLAQLSAREANLRARKAALKHGDHAGAVALDRDIAQYNIDLKGAAAQKKAGTTAPK